jgi:hypothetical protein
LKDKAVDELDTTPSSGTVSNRHDPHPESEFGNMQAMRNKEHFTSGGKKN